MASIDTLISVAEECVGMNLKECVKHFDTSDPGVDWCAWFVRQCGAKADMNFGSSNTASKLWASTETLRLSGATSQRRGIWLLLIRKEMIISHTLGSSPKSRMIRLLLLKGI